MNCWLTIRGLCQKFRQLVDQQLHRPLNHFEIVLFLCLRLKALEQGYSWRVVPIWPNLRGLALQADALELFKDLALLGEESGRLCCKVWQG